MGSKTAAGEIYDAGKEGINQALDFIQAQSPELLKEYLWWNGTSSLIYAIGAGILLVATIIGFIKMTKYIYSGKGAGFEPVLGLLLGLAIGTSVTCVNYSMNFVKIKGAPRVFLMERAVNILGDLRR